MTNTYGMFCCKLFQLGKNCKLHYIKSVSYLDTLSIFDFEHYNIVKQLSTSIFNLLYCKIVRCRKLAYC